MEDELSERIGILESARESFFIQEEKEKENEKEKEKEQIKLLVQRIYICGLFK